MQHNISSPTDVINLNRSIEYSNGAVVSKIVIKKPNGNITLFAFDAGEELSEHTTPFDALVQILDGAAEILIAGQRYNLKSGESIIFPGNIPHAVKATERFKMLLTMIK